MKDLINWHELSRRLSGNGQNIRPNSMAYNGCRLTTKNLKYEIR
jgi:hypothetical protein